MNGWSSDSARVRGGRVVGAMPLLVAFLLLSTVFWQAQVVAAGSDVVNLQILAINDLHGHIDLTETLGERPVGGAAYLASYMLEREREADNTIRVHAGDAVGASPPISGLLQDEPTIEILSFLGFELGIPGNHEFDEGLAELYRIQYGGRHRKTGYFRGSSFPLIVANVVHKETGHPIFPPYAIKVFDGVPVAFIGVVTEETPLKVAPKGVADLEFMDPVEAINTYVAEVRALGIEAIAVLAHEGGTYDETQGRVTGPIVEIARNIDDSVDVIVSGHTHQGYVDWIDGKLVTQAWSHGTAFTDIDLAIDRATGDVVAATAEVVTVWADSISPDPLIESLLERVRADVQPLTDRRVATTARRIERQSAPSGESALGNLVADAQRWATGSQIALMNPGGIRSDLPAGDVTWGALYSVSPFGNDLVQVKMTGAQVLRALNDQWRVVGDEVRVKILQPSGICFTYDDSRELGDRIVSASLSDGTPIEADAVYTVVINSFLYGGGDGFATFAEIDDRIIVGNDLDALVEYLESFTGLVDAEIEGRITRL